MYKKILSLALVFLMICSCFVLSVSAFEPLPDDELLKNKCKAEFMDEYNIPKAGEKDVNVLFAYKFRTYTVFSVRSEPYIDGEKCTYADGYWLYNGNSAGHYTLDNYGNVETLKETADQGFIDMDEHYPALAMLTKIHPSGDTDSDGRLSVKDATLIQKYLANYPDATEKITADPIMFGVADANLSGVANNSAGEESEITIKDATYIQKQVAKVIKEEDRPAFEYSEILVFTASGDEYLYMVEDFPEYEFESMKTTDLGYGYMYVIKLKNPGKENVIDAINSLRYREGVNIKSVSPNHIWYMDDC